MRSVWRGADPVIAVDVQPHCLASALTVGTTHAIHAGEDDVVALALLQFAP